MVHAGFHKAVVLAVLVFGTIPSPSIASERVALVIGNAAYEHTEPLYSPRNDAIDMARTLRDLGFAVIEGIDLEKAAFEGKLQEFARAAEGAEATLFYYAGHGLEVNRKNYLVPVDAALASVADVRFDVISLDTAMAEMRSEANIVFLDASRYNPLARNLASSMGPDRSAAVGRGLGPVEDYARMLVAYATAPGNVASDGDGENSPFTEALLANLAVPGVSVNDLITAVTDAVVTQTGGRQQPWSHSSLRKHFYFNPGGETETVDRTPMEAADTVPDESLGAQTADGTEASGHEATEREHPTAPLDATADNISGSIPAGPALEDIPKNEGVEAEQADAMPGASPVAPIAAPDNASGELPPESLSTELTEEVLEVNFGNDGNEWAHDGLCDDLRFDGTGMGETLTVRKMGRDAADCRNLLEQGRIRLHPLWGGPGDPLDFGNDGGERAHDGECDDLRFVGSGMGKTLLVGDAGRDAADCRSLFEQGRIRLHPLFGSPRDPLEFGDSGGEGANDGECDDPRFDGSGMAKTLLAGNMGRDAADCRILLEQGRIRLHPLFGGPGDTLDFGSDGSEGAQDGECDDPRFVGDGMAKTLLVGDAGRDAADCRSLFERGRIWLHPLLGGPRDALDFGNDDSGRAQDGECDDPRFVGDGMAKTLLVGDMGRDAADCRILVEQGQVQLNLLFGGPRDPLAFGDDGSRWANDGECDDPRFVGDGMAETLLAGDMGRDAADCRSLFEQARIRLHPLFGGPGDSLDFGDDGSNWVNNGECDDPRFVGDGMAKTLLAGDMGRDAADCRSLFEQARIRLHPLFGGPGDSLDFGDDGSNWVNNGECDDPRFVGDGMAETLLAGDMGRDAADCRSLFEQERIRLHPLFGGPGDSLESPRVGGSEDSLDFGDNSSEWAHDGECDDPRFAGDGMAETLLAGDMGRDAADCRSLFEQGRIRLESRVGGSKDSLHFGDNGSEWAHDGECDDPRFVGDGMAETLLAQDMGRDAADCRSLFEQERIRLHPLFGGPGDSLESPRVGGSEDSLDFGDNSSEWAHDGECDDPRFAGDGMAETLLAGDTGRDAADCRSLFEQGWIRLKPGGT